MAGGKAYFTTSGPYVLNGRYEYVWSTDGTLTGTSVVSEGVNKRWWQAASDGSSIIFADGSSDLWRSDDGMATVRLIARRQPNDSSIRKVGIAGGVAYFSRYQGLEQAQVFRASGNPDHPTLVATVSSNEWLIPMAGKMYISSIENGLPNVYSDNSADGSLLLDTSLSQFTLSGWRFAAGSSYVLGPAYFPDYGSEPGRVERDVEVYVDNRFVREDASAGSLVGKLKLAWLSDPITPTTFAFASGAGDGDNDLFSIDASGNLLVNGMLDYESSPVATLRIQASNAQGVFESQVLVFLEDVRDSVEEIKLSNSFVSENVSIGTAIGTLSSLPTVPGVVTYEVVAVDGLSTDMAFAMVGNELQTSQVLDFETQREYIVRVRAVDTSGKEGFADFTITVTNVNENAWRRFS